MPSSMIHLLIAKKINNPTANMDFYIGNIAPDSIKDRDIKKVNHLRDFPDMETALNKFASEVKNKNEYVKGIILHLFVDMKWNNTFISDFAEKNGEDWYSKYVEELGKAASYAFHNTDWAYELWEQMELCDVADYVQIKLITKEGIKTRIYNQRKWTLENKVGPSSAFPPEIIEKFAHDTAADFDKWFSELIG